jgi:hypothetical protein
VSVWREEREPSRITNDAQRQGGVSAGPRE